MLMVLKAALPYLQNRHFYRFYLTDKALVGQKKQASQVQLNAMLFHERTITKQNSKNDQVLVFIVGHAPDKLQISQHHQGVIWR